MSGNSNAKTAFIDFVVKEWLAVASGVGWLLTCVYARRLPVYSRDELQVLFILLVLFVAVNGIQQGGLILNLARNLEKGKLIPLKLVTATFFLSMLITNDVSLLVVVPLTLALRMKHKGIVVILQALAANAGSALTPLGNPQNLFIYWYYNVPALRFMATMAPFSLAFLFLLTISSAFLGTDRVVRHYLPLRKTGGRAYVHCFLLLLVVLTILRLMPTSSGLLVLAYAIFFDRRVLRVDYALLLTFFFFFGIGDNLQVLLQSEIGRTHHVFLFSALASQVMSNVPATLLLSNFTTHWRALLWGSNAGGFGSLFGSLANLIAYKLYVSHETTSNPAAFTTAFLLLGYLALAFSAALYFLLYGSA